MTAPQEKAGKELLTTNQVCLVAITGILAVALLTMTALLRNIDGIALAAGVGSICSIVAGTIGFQLKKFIS